jgi:copper(I)-binding protein
MHEMTMTGDMMSMARRETVDLPAGKTVDFKPNGLHLMVFSPNLTANPAAIPITIELESGLKRTVEFPSRK